MYYLVAKSNIADIHTFKTAFEVGLYLGRSALIVQTIKNYHDELRLMRSDNERHPGDWYVIYTNGLAEPATIRDKISNHRYSITL